MHFYIQNCLDIMNNEKIPGNLLKNLEKSWKNHGILPVRKSGNPAISIFSISDRYTQCFEQIILKIKITALPIHTH